MRTNLIQMLFCNETRFLRFDTGPIVVHQSQKSRHAQLHVDAEKHAGVLGGCVLFAKIGCVFVMQKFHLDHIDAITYQSTPNIIPSNFM